MAGDFDEATAVRRAVQGDAEAFGDLHETHVDRIYGHVLYRMRKLGEAEDATAQVSLNAWQAIGRYRPTAAPFGVWLLGIADNLVTSSFRRAGRSRCLEAGTGGFRSRDEDPEVHLERDLLWKALLELREEQRRVLVLRFVDDLTSAQVARIMGKSEGAVRGPAASCPCRAGADPRVGQQRCSQIDR